MMQGDFPVNLRHRVIKFPFFPKDSTFVSVWCLFPEELVATLAA